jgi:GT2 family glycosyltransferase
MGFHRTALEKVGPFDESLPIYHEEVEWQDRVRAAGGEIVYLPRAWLWHRRTTELASFRQRLTKSFRQGRGEALAFSRKNGRMRASVGFVTCPARITYGLAHAAHRRCSEGVVSAARQVGRLLGIAGSFARA